MEGLDQSPRAATSPRVEKGAKNPAVRNGRAGEGGGHCRRWNQSCKKPLPMISVELVMTVNAWGST